MAGEWHCTECGRTLNVLNIQWESHTFGHIACICGARFKVEGHCKTDREKVFYISENDTKTNEGE